MGPLDAYNASYYEEYANRGKTGSDTVMRSVARLMHLHCVGLLVCDEVQNLCNSHKGGDTVMTELVSACNELGLPILFIGTNKAAQVLTRDFRQARRSTGCSISPWDRLPEFVESDEINEWDGFLEVLWTYQWTKNVAPLDAAFSQLMYFYSQGVIDVAIKLFAAAQGMAMNDGSELVSLEHIEQAFTKHMSLLGPMIEALRVNDLAALARCEDIAPISMESIVVGAVRRARARTSPLTRTKSSDATFAPKLAASLAALGMAPEEAVSRADAVVSDNRVRTLGEGMQHVLAEAKVSSRPARKKTSTKVPEVVDYTERPNDYRRAQQEARLKGSTVFDQLVALGIP
ncbi:TniB family NTP-binding protein [Rugamonas sp.]|uniref:TniB family NTP-binding protein n=1 Tax=Rugamonas sp. TaxID=1926287 RepID=UPI0025D86552|nr:TniB family NTP-binding protein [Rugamonas sp.]